MTDDTEIRLPAAIVEQCEARIDGTEFESVEAYVRFTMRAVVDSDADDTGVADTGDDREDATEDVEDRLASLGYK